MSVLNQGRNEIRVNNSGAKCLLENWVEERAVKHLDPSSLTINNAESAKILKTGHTGLLSTQLEDKASDLTVVRETYKPPPPPPVRETGVRSEMLERELFNKLKQEVHEQENPPIPKVDFTSEMKAHYTREFPSHRPKPTRPHDVKSEQPVTFWTEHREVAHGVSQVRTRDTVFRKNTAFSRPIGEHWDQTQPYEQSRYPNM